MDIAKLRKFLMEWVLPPRGIRVVCYLMSRCLRGFSTILSYKRKSDRLYVLANGPSLTKDLEKYGEEMMAYDRLVVNFMGTSETYRKVRPSHYVLADPIFFVDPFSLPESSREKVLSLQKVFVGQTDWPMILCVPHSAKKAVFVNAVETNKKIRILYYWTGVPLPIDSEDFRGWARNLYSPPMQNIVHVAIFLGVVWRYPETILLGADSSFHTMIRVEQDTNRLYAYDEHFYGTERRYSYQDPECTIPQTMSGVLPNIWRVYAWHDKLRKLADYVSVRVVNASSFSWIDAYERVAGKRNRTGYNYA